MMIKNDLIHKKKSMVSAFFLNNYRFNCDLQQTSEALIIDFKNIYNHGLIVVSVHIFSE